MSGESIIQMAGAGKREKPNQEELRAKLEQRFHALKPRLEGKIKEYENALNDGTFDDQDGEADGEGEKRKVAMQKEIETLFANAQRIKKRLTNKELLKATTAISVTYVAPDGKVETINIDIESKLKDFISFYAITKIDLPPDFEDTIRDIWCINHNAIEEAMEQNGFDEILIIPGNIPLTELKDKMTMENGYFEFDNFKNGGSFAGAISPNANKSRLILVHRTKELTDRPELNQTLNTPGNAVRPDQALSLEDYIVFQHKYFEETGVHLDETKWTWLSTKSGARLVNSSWLPDRRELIVHADDFEAQDGNLGIRPSRSFF